MYKGHFKGGSETGWHYLTAKRADLKFLPSQKWTPRPLNGFSVVMLFVTPTGLASAPLDWDSALESNITVVAGKDLLAKDIVIAPIK